VLARRLAIVIGLAVVGDRAMRPTQIPPPGMRLLPTAETVAQAGAAIRTTFRLPDTVRMGPTARAIIRIERTRSPAIAANDSATLRRIYAADFRGVNAAGLEVDREQLLAVFARDDASSRFIIDEMAVPVVRDGVAVFTGRLTTLNGGQVVGLSRYIHVYEHRRGGWQIVRAMGTPLRVP